MQPVSGPDITQVLAKRPELASGFQVFYRTLWTSEVPSRVLELCRAQVACIHDRGASFDPGDYPHLEPEDFEMLHHQGNIGFDVAECAALEVASAMPFAHHDVTDEQVQELARHFGHRGCVTLLTAIAFFDALSRMELVLDVPHAIHERKLSQTNS